MKRSVAQKTEGSPADAAERERDLPLKIACRRLFWSMGYSTKIDVRLRAYIADGNDRSPGWQEYTDLDVLGIGQTPAGQVHVALADCKTVRGRALERMFWVRGVADFFAADDAYLVRSQPVPAAARSLSARIGVGVLAPDDLAALADTFPSSLDWEGPLSCLLDPAHVQRELSNSVGLDQRLNPLINYLTYDYWVYEPYRNLSQVVAHLAESVSHLDPSDPRHRSLLYDCSWLYAVALGRATAHVRATRMGDVLTAVRAYVAGGELALREKGQLAALLDRAGIRVDTRSAVLPPYITTLAELLTRFLVRPVELPHVLRYAEFLGAATASRMSVTVAEAFGESVRPIAAKLLADICGFLVSVAGLRPDFRTAAREQLVADLTGGGASRVNTVDAGTSDATNAGVSDQPLPFEIGNAEPPSGAS